MSRLLRHPADHADADPVVPSWALFAAAGMLSLSILAAAIGGKPVTVPAVPQIASRALLFEDAADGAVLVRDAVSHAAIARMAPGTNGFARATLRGLAHANGHEAVPLPVHAFTLTAWEDGRVTLDDPATGRRLDLEAFGQTNAGSFAALLTATEIAP